MNGKQTIDVGKRTAVVLQDIGGDVVLKGWGRDEIQLAGPQDQITTRDEGERIFVTCEITTRDEGERIFVTCAGDLSLFLPHRLSVDLKKVGGDASLANLGGDLTILQVGGDLTLRDVHHTKVEDVGGDLLARHLRDSLAIHRLGGDCIIHDLDGQMTGTGIGGDLLAHEIGGGVDVTVGGDIHARFSPVPWQVYAFNAKGDLFVRVPEDSNARYKITSQQVSITLPKGEDGQRINKPEFVYEMGKGGPQVTLAAQGEVTLGTDAGKWSPDFRFDADLEGLADHISAHTTAQIQDQLSSLEKHLDKHLSGVAKSLETLDLPQEKLQQIQNKIEDASRRATLKAHKATQKAEAKLEKKLALAQKKARRKGTTFDWQEFVSQKERESFQASEDERLLILKMLEEKKISAEEADELLSALGGK